MEEFDAKRKQYLNKLWKRMASGRYFPPPVKEVEIPKKDGKFCNQPCTTGKLFLGFDCTISISSRKRIADRLKELRLISRSFKSIVGIAHKLNPMIRGWVRYYGRYRSFELNRVFHLWLERIRKQFPNLFYHWQLGYV